MEGSYIVDLDDDEGTPLIGFFSIYVFWVTTGLEMTYGIIRIPTGNNSSKID